MLSLKDCLDLSGVSDAELVAITRHEHIPPVVALELGHRLIQSAGGLATLRRFILDDIASAQRQGRCRDCEQFSRTLWEYDEKHPELREIASGQDESVRELLAIGQVAELRELVEGPDDRRRFGLDEVQGARDRHDCCTCRCLSLALLRRLNSSGAATVTG